MRIQRKIEIVFRCDKIGNGVIRESLDAVPRVSKIEELITVKIFKVVIVATLTYGREFHQQIDSNPK